MNREPTPVGAVERLSGAPDLATRLWQWEFLLAGRPAREMAAGGLFADAIARATLEEDRAGG
jgi:hypothetical protein